MRISGDFFGLNFYGFDYDPSEENYVVVQIYLSKCDPSHHAFVYSLNGASWRDFEDESLKTITQPCISVHQGYSKFYQLNIPGEVELEEFSLCCLRNIRHCLAFYTVKRDENWDYMVGIWEMEEYDVHTSWTKVTSMQVSNNFAGYMLPACSSDDSIIFVNSETRVMATWNARDETLQYRTFDRVVQYEHQMIVCEETLLST
ncbi:uncharacterized protein LOC109806297 [Cajanus cajan]|uniref:uncharacterized protein LOC109806297 n=1 Tax=Cajanus cajan TaxID=3821 RepID=UPI00098DB0C8|nr:uncharacterized protein LOC109806297 [Cajanus cajan]